LFFGIGVPIGYAQVAKLDKGGRREEGGGEGGRKTCADWGPRMMLLPVNPREKKGGGENPGNWEDDRHKIKRLETKEEGLPLSI